MVNTNRESGGIMSKRVREKGTERESKRTSKNHPRNGKYGLIESLSS